MTRETQQWLGPMISALLRDEAGAAAFARFMQAAVTTDGEARFDWLRMGQMIRDEIGWEHYPTSPHQYIERG